MSAPVTITAGEADGEKKGPAKFTTTFYTGGALEVAGWDLPVVVDLSGLDRGNVLVANLDHDRSKRVGNFDVANNGRTLVASGTASAATAARDEVVNSALDGYQWQSSLEVNPAMKHFELVKANKTVEVNGQSFTGPLYVARKGTLKGFGFVSHGADDNTTVTIAANAASDKGNKMEAELKEWIEGMGFDAETLAPEQLEGLKANFAGKQKPKATIAASLGDGIEAKKAERLRVDGITEIALGACDKRPYDIEAIKALAEQAIAGKWTVEKFKLELLEASIPPAHTVFRTKRDDRMNGNVVQAAICMTGRLPGHEKMFDDQTLQAAHDKFKGGIGLKQIFLMCAEANGYHGSYSSDVNIEVQRAAFGMTGPQTIKAEGWSTLSISDILSNVANKFLMSGWNAVEMTAMRIAAIRSVRDFKEITTTSLTGDLMFEKLGAAGEIKHGTLGNKTYGNKADTYAKMLAITRQDIFNDDLGALTAVPQRLGRGSALKLNDIFWTEFLNPSTASFFSSTNSNVSTDTGALGLLGLQQAETIFLNQTDPDGKPLGIDPKILLVPNAIKATGAELMTSEYIVTGSDVVRPSANVWRGRFRLESSAYLANSSYTGYSASKWYLLADPNELPLIEIVALNGRVEPVIETADADFNVLGVQMRGYSDVGVRVQEYRAGVQADGTAAG
jgi:hypothetical protein